MSNPHDPPRSRGSILNLIAHELSNSEQLAASADGSDLPEKQRETLEALLRHHQLVRDVAVRVRNLGGQRPNIVAYITPTNTSIGAGIKNQLSRYLRSMEVDLRSVLYVVRETLPQSSTGIIDEVALSAIPIEQRSKTEADVPATWIEERLSAIWQELFGFDNFSVEDNFFEMGGDSLLAVRALSAVRRELGVELPLTLVFQQEITIRTLAITIEKILAAESGLDPECAVRELRQLTSEQIRNLVQRKASA